jgi:O-antigen/teichoic acid export membrane protein
MGLLIGHVVSQSGGCTSLYISFYQKLKINLKHVSVKRMAFVFKHYSDFPKFRLPSQFLLAFSGNAPLLFIGMLFDKQTTGQLGLALTTLALPMALFGNTTGRAYYAEIAKIGRKNPEQIRQITKSVTKKLFLVSILPLLLLLLAGPWMFTMVFGEVWSKAGEFARILAVYLVAQFVTSPLVNALNVFEKQFIFLKINIYRSIIMLIIFGISYVMLLSSYQTIFIYSIFMTFHYSFTSFQIYKVINQAIKQQR